MALLLLVGGAVGAAVVGRLLVAAGFDPVAAAGWAGGLVGRLLGGLAG